MDNGVWVRTDYMESLVLLKGLRSKMQVEKIDLNNVRNTFSTVTEKVMEKIGLVVNRFIDFLKQKEESSLQITFIFPAQRLYISDIRGFKKILDASGAYELS